MKLALGYAFDFSDLLFNFPRKKLNLTSKQCQAITGDRHRNVLIKKIFRACVKLVIDDVVDRNVTFWLPLVGAKKCNIHMKRVTGKDFQRLRKAGKWDDVDIVNSGFSGYEIGFFMLGNRTPRVKTVYVKKSIKKIISENTNKGKAYGDGCIDTTINDYIPVLQEQFKGVTRHDIKLILSFLWKSVYLHNSYGGDVLIWGDSLWYYIGKIQGTPLQHFHYYKKKLIIKIRLNYRRKKNPRSGYYYFGLTDDQYANYLQQQSNKYFISKNIFLYQILEECKVKESDKKYIFRTPYSDTTSFKIMIKDFKGEVELIEVRNSLKFKDILVENNKYEFI